MPRLLVRPEREAGEWAPSWISRSLKANGLPCTYELPRGGTEHWAWAVMDAEVLKQCDISLIDKHTAKFCGHTLPVSAIRLLNPGISACPACIRGRRVIPAIWCLREYTVCHIHHRPLVSRCGSCSRPLNIERLLDGECACAIDPIVEGANPTATSVAIEWAQYVWPAAKPEFADPGAARLAHRILLARLLLVVARSRRGRDLKLRAFAPPVHADLWLKREGLMTALQGGEIHQFLSALVHPVHRRAAALFIQRTLDLERAHPTIFSMLPLKEWLEIVAPHGHIGPGIGGLTCLLYAARRPGFEPLGTAAQRLGIPRQAVKTAVGPENLLEPISYGNGRRLQLVRTEAVERAAKAMQDRSCSLANREDSAWQIPRKVARQLVLSGWLQTPEPRQEFRKPSKEAVRQMLLRLRACARGAPPTGQRTIALSSPYLYKNIVSLAVGELLSKVISGAVPLYASTPSPDFDGLTLPLEVLPSLWRSRLKQQGEAVSPSLQVELFQC